MKKEDIENVNTLIAAMQKGVNLFVGAGFSLDASDCDGNSLPTGQKLSDELHTILGPGPKDLDKYCTVKRRTDNDKLNEYLTKRFNVTSYKDYYNNINLLALNSVFTTNIDNLIPQILQKDPERYVNDQRANGERMDKEAINFLPLHGCVDEPERGYTFTTAEIANTFHDNGRSWNYLIQSIEKCPTIFIGYSLNDTSTIEALTSSQTFENAKKDMWILLLKPDPDAIDYFKAFDFNIMVGDTKGFLELIPELLDNIGKTKKTKRSLVEKFLQSYLVPKDNRGQVQRPIEEFFRGYPPTWSDILRNLIYKTSYFKEVQDSIYNPKKHTIIIGSPVSGKTTIAMQVGYSIEIDGNKLYLQDLTMSRAQYLSKLIGKDKVAVFVENFTDDIDAFLYLRNCPNVKLVGIDRTLNFGNVSHKIDSNLFNIINVTELSDADFQGIYNSLPKDIKKGQYRPLKKSDSEKDSIYEFVKSNISKETISERYKRFMRDLEASNDDLAQFLVLCAYMDSCHVPMTMDVAYSYFYDLPYTEVLGMQQKLNDMLREDHSADLGNDTLEGYRPRSFYIADAILEFASVNTLSAVLDNFLDSVSKLQICNYKTFRRWAFDKDLIAHAFPKWSEGMDFFKKAFMYDDRNPYVLQQGALYLSDHRQYQVAFTWIDRAINMTNNKYFSIRNSHAIILFNANYDVDTLGSIMQLDASMDILKKCFNDDKRRVFHAITFAKQAIKYYKKYPTSDKTLEYLKLAKSWLDSEYIDKPWHHEIKDLLNRITEILLVEVDV